MSNPATATTETPSAPPAGPGLAPQALLKRRAGSSIKEFKEHYIQRHAPIALPWALANGVSYYAQLHQPLRWATPELEAKYTAAGVNLMDWDAAGEMHFPPVLTLEDFYRAKVGHAYHVEVIVPDERRFLLASAFEHMGGVQPGAVVGERVEFIVGGKAVVEFGKAKGVWEGYGGR
ncbi:hypothetical protein LTR53_005933 [Teratosphaeriaceae sp. CCFEE 6253]|nr:hypothetical protein LTR53_005933 [Teratosphaeriaceae sp. CCFEE 6253]